MNKLRDLTARERELIQAHTNRVAATLFKPKSISFDVDFVDEFIDETKAKVDSLELPDAEASALAFAERRNAKKTFTRGEPLGNTASDNEIVETCRAWLTRQRKRGHGK
jgi:hypothetical protein